MVQNCNLNHTCRHICRLTGSLMASRNDLFLSLWSTIRPFGPCTASQLDDLHGLISHVALRSLPPTLSTAFFFEIHKTPVFPLARRTLPGGSSERFWSSQGSKIHPERPLCAQNNEAKHSIPAIQRPKSCSYVLECRTPFRPHFV